MTSNDASIFQPQRGPQQAFLSSSADIAIMGGAAGGGKTYGLLLEAMRFFNQNGVNSAIFRREGQQLNNPGSIWLESQKMYPKLGLKPHRTLKHYEFADNSYLKFSGLQYENDVLDWQGAQLDFVGFDELTHFTAGQFWYLIARLRSVSGAVRPYCRATCNPDPGWVFDLIKWWVDEKTGYPIADRSGKLRWFYHLDDILYWFDTREIALKSLRQKGIDSKLAPLSLTFIPATLNDNQILLANDPSYYAKLAQLPEADRIQLLEGRWFFKPAGKLFNPQWYGRYALLPRTPEVILITTDTASSTKTANDYTCFQAWLRKDGQIYLIDELHGKYTTQQQLFLLSNFIVQHQAQYVSIERASSGFHLIDQIVKKTGVLLLQMTRAKDKYTRGYDVQTYVQQGYVLLNPNSAYYAPFIAEHAAFAPENKTNNKIHDDRVDCSIDAIYHLLIKKIGMVVQKAPIPLTPQRVISAGGV